MNSDGVTRKRPSATTTTRMRKTIKRANSIRRKYQHLKRSEWEQVMWTWYEFLTGSAYMTGKAFDAVSRIEAAIEKERQTIDEYFGVDTKQRWR